MLWERQIVVKDVDEWMSRCGAVFYDKNKKIKKLKNVGQTFKFAGYLNSCWKKFFYPLDKNFCFWYFLKKFCLFNLWKGKGVINPAKGGIKFLKPSKRDKMTNITLH